MALYLRLILERNIIKKLLFLLLFTPLVSLSQALDYETTSFEIKALTLTNSARSILSYDLNNEQIPTRLKQFDSRSRQEIYNTSQSFIYSVRSNFNTKNFKNPVIKIAPLNVDDLHAFWGDSSIDVKNIAYKPSTGGNIFSAYCAATYAANNQQN